MRRVLSIAIALLTVVSLTGCFDNTTSEYRSYAAFVSKHEPGIDAAEIADTLGFPDDYCDEHDVWHAVSYPKEDHEEEILAQTKNAVWIFECYQHSDPADPYRLKITFDSEGKSIKAELLPVYGG